jgi:hypothetical protein
VLRRPGERACRTHDLPVRCSSVPGRLIVLLTWITDQLCSTAWSRG